MPFNPKLYHPKWTLIGRLIRRRANYCCENCGVPDGTVGYWIDERFRSAQELIDHFENTGEDLCTHIPADKEPWAIVLTTAHLDHDINNNRFWNLRAFCQVCHLRHDRKDNAIRRRYGPHGKMHFQLVLTYESPEGKLIRADQKKRKQRI